MSQSSYQESANLLSPLPEPMADVTGINGLMTVAGDDVVDSSICNEVKARRESNIVDNERCEASARDNRIAIADMRSSCDDMVVEKRANTAATFTSQERRSRPNERVGSPSNNNSTSEQCAKKAANAAVNSKPNQDGGAECRDKTISSKTNVLKYPVVYARDSSPTTSENVASDSNAKLSNGGAAAAVDNRKKSASEEFELNYMPYAKSENNKTNQRNIRSISCMKVEAEMLNKFIEVPPEHDQSNEESELPMSQITMVGGTQAFTGRRDDEDYDQHDEHEPERDNDNGTRDTNVMDETNSNYKLISSAKKQTREQTILTNYNAIENIGKALSCPICCHSLKSSTFLPCGHAFCHPCLSDSLRTAFSCPVCRLQCSRRSGSKTIQLDEIVNGFKGVMRAFGFAPVVHSKRVMMTQLSPGEDCLEAGVTTVDDGERAYGLKKRRTLNMDEALEHHQVAQSNHEAFASLQKLQAPVHVARKSSGNRMTKEEIERLNITRRYKILAEDQVAVMQADKEVLEKVTTTKNTIALATLEAIKGGEKNEEYSKERNHKRPPEATPKALDETFSTTNKSRNEECQVDKNDLVSSAIPPSLPPNEFEDTSHTIKPELLKETESTQFQRESIATATSPTILHDGNTAKKDKPANLKENIESRYSLSTAASTILLHDGNTAKKSISRLHYTPRKSDRYSPPSDKDDQKVTEAALGDKQSPPSLSNRDIVVGSIVMVQSRTWPGINRHGGVGRVTKVDSTRSTKQYDVTYILGGKEKSVDEIYISLHEPELSNNACLSVGKRIPMSAEKVSRPLRKRKTQEKKPEPSHFLQTFNDEELQHIPLDVLEWAGIAHTARPTKGKEAAKKVCSKTLSTKPSARKKRVLADANGNVTPEKSMKLTAISTKNRAKSDRPIISFQDAIESINNVELIRRADARYSSLLSMEEHSTFHAVISSLSESDTKLLTSLIKILKSRNITLKIMKDFKPGKTQFCLTSAIAPASTKQNMVSTSRTLKVMRSALHGLPILTPQWIESCLRKKGIIASTNGMCIRTLPRKTAVKNGDSLASFGVSKYAAALNETNSKVLSKCSVFLCGDWKTSGRGTMKDLRILLEDAGANVITSGTTASKVLTDIFNDGSSSEYFVLLCDNSVTNTDCGVSDTLFRVGMSAISQVQSRVLPVHFHWLFDCVSCAKLLPGIDYEPLAPRTKQLWNLSCAGNVDEK